MHDCVCVTVNKENNFGTVLRFLAGGAIKECCKNEVCTSITITPTNFNFILKKIFSLLRKIQTQSSQYEHIEFNICTFSSLSRVNPIFPCSRYLDEPCLFGDLCPTPRFISVHLTNDAVARFLRTPTFEEFSF